MKPERWERIERLFHSALEREGDERAAYLQQACAGDDLLRQEVDSLLAQGETAGGLLGTSALGKMAAEIVGERDGRSLVGMKLGSYQILSLLGVGGMGEVYQAHDSKLRRDVAIKVLPAAFRARFRAAGALSARSANAGLAESSQHRDDSRAGAVRRRALSGDGTGSGRRR